MILLCYQRLIRMLRKALTRDWRDASTLMLMAKTAPTPTPCTCDNDISKNSFYTIFPDERTRCYNKVTRDKQATETIVDWRLSEADSTLTVNEIGSIDFKTLMLTRSSRSKFMPNALVFPGGVVDQADCSEDWFRIIDLAMDNEDLDHPTSAKIPLEKRPPIFSTPMFSHEVEARWNAVAIDYALRICAIRETFEEIGILIVTNGHNVKQTLSREEMASWRRLVRKNPENFKRMCEDIGMAPDIWSLYEWSNWLTPTKLNVQSPLEQNPKRSTRRFDTMFYIAMLDEIPDPSSYSEDAAEVVKGQWLNPVEALEQHYSGSGWMAPPQIYEQARLMRLTDFNGAHRYAASREEFSSSRWLPVAVHADDGVLSVLPGDSLYPDDPTFDFNQDEPPAFHGTIGELREKSVCHNRFEIRGPTDVSLICNIACPNRHVMPLSVLQSPV